MAQKPYYCLTLVSTEDFATKVAQLLSERLFLTSDEEQQVRTVILELLPAKVSVKTVES